MGKRRKPLSEQKGHLTILAQEAMKEQEAMLKGDNDWFDTVPAWLIDKRAKDLFVRLAAELKKTGLISNLDYNALGNYCNEFTLYTAIVNRLKKEPLMHGDEVNEVREKLCRQLSFREDQLRKFGAICGLSIDSRLKFANNKQNETEESLDDKFGVI